MLDTVTGSIFTLADSVDTTTTITRRSTTQAITITRPAIFIGTATIFTTIPVATNCTAPVTGTFRSH